LRFSSLDQAFNDVFLKNENYFIYLKKIKIRIEKSETIKHRKQCGRVRGLGAFVVVGGHRCRSVKGAERASG
jgi:hypothetical protein